MLKSLNFWLVTNINFWLIFFVDFFCRTVILTEFFYRLTILVNSNSSSTWSSKKNSKYFKNKQKNMCVCIHGIIQLIIMKMKRRSHRYNINRLSSRNRYKCSKFKMCLNVMMFLCIKQHLTNTWSSIQNSLKD